MLLLYFYQNSDVNTIKWRLTFRVYMSNSKEMKLFLLLSFFIISFYSAIKPLINLGLFEPLKSHRNEYCEDIAPVQIINF